MPVLVVTLSVAVAVGALVGAVVARVPAFDETGPRLGVQTVVRAVREHKRLAAVERRMPASAMTGLALVVAMCVVALGATGTGVLLAMVRDEVGLYRADGPVAEWAAVRATPVGTDVLGWLSKLGGTQGVVIVATAVALFEWRRTGRRAEIFLLALTVGGQLALTNLIKIMVDRARPEIQQLTGHAGASFPSGHAAAAAATFAAVALVVGRGRSHNVKTALWGAAAGIAVAVAITRVMLGVHWTTDVIAGLLVGWGWFALCSAAFGGRVLRFGEPSEIAHSVAVTPGRRT